MGRTRVFESGLCVSNEYINSCVESIFLTIKESLPEEAQTTEAIIAILDIAKEKLQYKQISL